MNGKTFLEILSGLLLAVLASSVPLLADDGPEDEEDAREERTELLHQIAEAHFEKAAILEESGRVDAAIEELRRIETLPFPDEEDVEEQLFEVNVFMAELYLEAERFKEAETLLNGALKRFSDPPSRSVQLHTLMGYALREQGRGEEALKHFDRAIDLGRKALEAD